MPIADEDRWYGGAERNWGLMAEMRTILGWYLLVSLYSVVYRYQ